MSVEQLNLVLDFFPSAGYLRVQLLLSVFSHLVDLENLWPSIDKLFNEDERDEVGQCRENIYMHNPYEVIYDHVLFFLRSYSAWVSSMSTILCILTVTTSLIYVDGMKGKWRRS